MEPLISVYLLWNFNPGNEDITLKMRKKNLIIRFFKVFMPATPRWQFKTAENTQNIEKEF